MRHKLFIAAFALAASLTACGGGGSSSPPPVATGITMVTPTPTPTSVATVAPSAYSVRLLWTGGAGGGLVASDAFRSIANGSRATKAIGFQSPIVITAPDAAAVDTNSNVFYGIGNGQSNGTVIAQVLPAPSSSPTATFTSTVPGTAIGAAFLNLPGASFASITSSAVNTAGAGIVTANVSVPGALATSAAIPAYVYKRFAIGCPPPPMTFANVILSPTGTTAIGNPGPTVPSAILTLPSGASAPAGASLFATITAGLPPLLPPFVLAGSTALDFASIKPSVTYTAPAGTSFAFGARNLFGVPNLRIAVSDTSNSFGWAFNPPQITCSSLASITTCVNSQPFTFVAGVTYGIAIYSPTIIPPSTALPGVGDRYVPGISVDALGNTTPQATRAASDIYITGPECPGDFNDTSLTYPTVVAPNGAAFIYDSPIAFTALTSARFVNAAVSTNMLALSTPSSQASDLLFKTRAGLLVKVHFTEVSPDLFTPYLQGPYAAQGIGPDSF